MTVKQIRAVKHAGQTSGQPIGQLDLVKVVFHNGKCRTDKPGPPAPINSKCYLPPLPVSGRVYNFLVNCKYDGNYEMSTIVEKALLMYMDVFEGEQLAMGAV
jgi:hypothetical protein